MARILSGFLLLLVVLIVLGFAVLNPSETVSRIDLWYLGKVYEAPLVLVVFVAFLLGCLLTFVFLIVRTLRLQFRIRELRKQTREYERELVAIRNIPVEEGGEGEDRSLVPGQEE